MKNIILPVIAVFLLISGIPVNALNSVSQFPNGINITVNSSISGISGSGISNYLLYNLSAETNTLFSYSFDQNNSITWSYGYTSDPYNTFYQISSLTSADSLNYLPDISGGCDEIFKSFSAHVINLSCRKNSTLTSQLIFSGYPFIIQNIISDNNISISSGLVKTIIDEIEQLTTISNDCETKISIFGIGYNSDCLTNKRMGNLKYQSLVSPNEVFFEAIDKCNFNSCKINYYSNNAYMGSGFGLFNTIPEKTEQNIYYGFLSYDGSEGYNEFFNKTYDEFFYHASPNFSMNSSNKKIFEGKKIIYINDSDMDGLINVSVIPNTLNNGTYFYYNFPNVNMTNIYINFSGENCSWTWNGIKYIPVSSCSFNNLIDIRRGDIDCFSINCKMDNSITHFALMNYKFLTNTTKNLIVSKSPFNFEILSNPSFSIKIISPKNQSYNGTRLVNLSIIKSGAINTTWYYNGTANVTFSGLEEYFLGNYGSNQIIVYANDSTGAINKSEKIVYSLDVPNISLITPKNQSYYKRALNITISKTGTFNTTWYFNGTKNVTFSGLETYPYYMTDNYSQITIYGNDSYGRIFSSGKISFNIDLNPPEIIFSSDSSNSTLTSYPKYILANATFSDYFGIQNMTLFINNSNGIISSYSFTTGNNITMNLTGLTLPYYSYWFEAKDNNNVTSKTVPRYIGSIWGYSTQFKRKLITLNESLIYGRNFNFPIFIKITDTQILSYPENQIFFTSANGKDKLKFYFEKFNTSEASAWIKYDIKNETKNYIWVYYNGASGSYEDEAETFSDYIMRFSMNTIPIKDSIGNVSCIAVNSPILNRSVAGNGILFLRENSQYFDCYANQSAILKNIQEYTSEFLVLPDENYKHALIGFGGLKTNTYHKSGTDSGGQGLDYIEADDGTSAGFHSGYLMNSRNWYYTTYAYDKSFMRESLELSITGFSTSLQYSKSIKKLNNSEEMAIGAESYGFQSGSDWISGRTNIFNGTIDEMRISNFSRSNEYLKTTYYNLKTNSQFYSLSAENYLPFFTIIKPCSECEYASFSQIIFNITGDYETCYLLLDGINKNVNCSSGIYNEILGLGKHSLFMWLNSTSNLTSSDFRYFYVYQEIQGNMTNTDLFGADMPIREKFCLGSRLITVREKTYCSGGTCQTFNTTEAEICSNVCIKSESLYGYECGLSDDMEIISAFILFLIGILIYLYLGRAFKSKRKIIKRSY